MNPGKTGSDYLFKHVLGAYSLFDTICEIMLLLLGHKVEVSEALNMVQRERAKAPFVVM